MSKLAHSNQETMDELDRRRAVENGDANISWIDWPCGKEWDGNPDLLVWVKFDDGESDDHLDPMPASCWNIRPDLSNWVGGPGGQHRIIAYAEAV